MPGEWSAVISHLGVFSFLITGSFVPWFGLAGRWWMWSVSQLNLQFSWTLQSDSVPAVSLRTSPASVCSKRCEHIVAGRLEAWTKQFTEGGRKGQKGKEGERREREVESSHRLMNVCVLSHRSADNTLKQQTRDSCHVCCLHLFLLTFF